MIEDKNRVCPVERAGSLETRLRRLIQRPRRLLGPHVSEGMTVLDVGCGPGFFSIELAKMVGKSGRVIAVDLQQGMLNKLRAKIEGAQIAERITLQRCEADSLGVSVPVDFALAFYMVHEVPDKAGFFRQIASVLKRDGRLLVVEPPFRVTEKEFEETIGKAREAGLDLVEKPRVFLGRTALLARDHSRADERRGS